MARFDLDALGLTPDLIPASPEELLRRRMIPSLKPPQNTPAPQAPPVIGRQGVATEIPEIGQPRIPGIGTLPIAPSTAQPQRPPGRGTPEDWEGQRLGVGPRPEYHGWKRFLDTLGGATNIGQAIEAASGMGTIGWRSRLGGAERAEQYEQSRRKEQEQEQLSTPEKRRAYMQTHPDLFQGVTDFERNDFVLSGKFPLREPSAPKPENVQQEYSDAVADAISRGVDPNKDQKVLQIADAIQRVQKEPAPKTPSEKEQDISDYLAANNLPNTPANREKARTAITERGKTPRQPTDREEWMKDHPGASVEDYWRAKQGLTTATRSMAEIAPKVKSLIARMNERIMEAENNLGPMASRWREFKAGKVGWNDPAFSKLRTDAALLQTALMRMHVGARGGELIMQHFKDLFDVGKQSPENLRAALEEIGLYADDVMAEGKAVPPQKTKESRGIEYKPGLIRGGYRFRGGDPAKQENWEKVSGQ